MSPETKWQTFEEWWENHGAYLDGSLEFKAIARAAFEAGAALQSQKPVPKRQKGAQGGTK